MNICMLGFIFKQDPVCVTVALLRTSPRIYFQGLIIQSHVMIVIFSSWLILGHVDSG